MKFLMTTRRPWMYSGEVTSPASFSLREGLPGSSIAMLSLTISLRSQTSTLSPVPVPYSLELLLTIRKLSNGRKAPETYEERTFSGRAY